jgi:hypothetical protein
LGDESKLSKIERFGGKVFECFGTIGTDNRRGRNFANRRVDRLNRIGSGPLEQLAITI